ncbi:MAG: metal-binding protein [Candidatus Aureabacteria bacterium]|nr:metal-binding protein [Candidatus Auribacterota bacterium]
MKKRSARNGVSFKGKIKTEHAIIEGLFDKLQILASWDEVHSVIPGRIMRRGSALPHPTLTLTIPTSSGWKALGKSKGSTQEIFIITNEPETVRNKFREKAF